MNDDRTPTGPHTQALACNVYALSEAERSAHFALAEALFTHAVQETRELPDGYAFCFDAQALPRVAAFVSDERRCCPFVMFTIDVEPYTTVVWLRLTGDEQVKPFLHTAFNVYGRVGRVMRFSWTPSLDGIRPHAVRTGVTLPGCVASWRWI